MKNAVVNLYGFFVLLFAVLIGFTSYWSVFDAKALRNEPSNHRDELQEARIPRGTITTADGKLIAKSTKQPKGTYLRHYPLGALFGHPIGYSYANYDSSGTEKYWNDRLTGRKTELVTAYDSLLGRKRVGEDLETTLDAKVQQVATDALKASPTGKGAVVALDVKTGAVKAMVSSPGFDPNNLEDGKTFSRLSTDNANTPLFNRATQSGYPPGSTFKAVTAAAAIDSGKYTPDSQISGRNGVEISGVPLQNFGGETFGSVSLTFALTNSINTVFGQIGEALGKPTMQKYMDRFGFNSEPPIDLPGGSHGELRISGERDRNSGKLLKVTSDKVDVGRMAIGQDQLAVTPLQMAEVAQTIGNGGVRMEPYIVDSAYDADGRRTYHHDPQEAERVISSTSAATMKTMMQQVVREGTGTAAALSGVDLAGKTGTAEIDPARGINDLWFIGFTDDHAVAVVLEKVQGGTGGPVAGPIAKAVLEALGDG
jgi:peptidoglycan glycosyltransferase